jgi:hypothetical protein
VARWGGLGSRAGFLSRSWGLDSPPAPRLVYFDLERLALGFLVLGGGVFKSRLATSSNGRGLCPRPSDFLFFGSSIREWYLLALPAQSAGNERDQHLGLDAESVGQIDDGGQ